MNKVARLGEQTGVVENARVIIAPSAQRRSDTGVLISEFPYAPSVFGAWSSVRTNTTFGGRPFFAVSSLDPGPHPANPAAATDPRNDRLFMARHCSAARAAREC